jgi:UDP-N-acetyl-2-amino-2-deoxyglucuronate dehydrogenase
MNPLRFGLVGCGGIAGLHAGCLQRLEAAGVAKLVAGAEIDDVRRAEFGSHWSIPMHASLADLLARDDIDAVTVTSPSGLHAEHTIQIAESGRHILCEKPLDTRTEKAEASIDAARRNNVTLSGIFQQRFAPGPMKVKRAVDQGFFGKIIFVHCETPWFRSQGYYDSGEWRGTWALDGGVLSNQAPHMLDRLMWLSGCDVAEVLSATCETRGREIEAETLAVATVRMANGALGTITGTTLAYDGLPQRVLICGEDGSAAFSGDDLTYFKTRRPFEEPETATLAAAGGENKASDPLALSSQGHEANIRDFISAVQDNREPLCTPEDGLRVVRLLNRIYEKAGVGPYAP